MVSFDSHVSKVQSDFKTWGTRGQERPPGRRNDATLGSKPGEEETRFETEKDLRYSEDPWAVFTGPTCELLSTDGPEER